MMEEKSGCGGSAIEAKEKELSYKEPSWKDDLKTKAKRLVLGYYKLHFGKIS